MTIKIRDRAHLASPALGGARISIVIATFNAGKYLAGCLDSCIRQTWWDKEIIVIDGASTDQTLDVIRKYEHQIAFWQSEPDKGIYDAWNKALPHVTGSWVLFRGADDLFWDDGALERAAEGLAKAAPDELLCYGSVGYVDDEGRLLRTAGLPWERAKARFFRRMSIPHPGTFHHVDLFRRFGRFDDSYRIAGDYEFLLRALKNGDVVPRFLPGAMITRMRGSGVSNTRPFLTKRESISALKRNHISRVPLAQCWEMAVVAFIVMRRKLFQKVFGADRMARLREHRHTRMSERAQRALAGIYEQQ